MSGQAQSCGDRWLGAGFSAQRFEPEDSQTIDIGVTFTRCLRAAGES